MTGRKWAVGVAIAALAIGGCATAQEPPATAAAKPAGENSFEVPRATAYLEVTKWPDWTGIWYPDWTLLFAGRERAAPKWNAETQKRADAYQELIKETGPSQAAQAQCLPPGLPGVMQQPFPIEFYYTPGRINIFTEAYSQVRRVYMDQDPPEDPDLFFNGNSVGHWEGDTLVIDTNGLSPSTFMAPGINHTENSRLRERIYLQAPGQMIDEMTFTNPDLLAEPFVTKVAYKLDNDFPIREYVCAENNHLRSDGHGANIDLGDLDDEGGEEDPFAGTEN